MKKQAVILLFLVLTLSVSAEAAVGNAAPRGLLSIKFVNSEEKIFNLPITEIDSFVNWYNTRAAGNGNAYYILEEPSKDKFYEKSKVYILHDKLLYFTISEFKTGK